jgi:K+-sensing histidine kinase KdpD
MHMATAQSDGRGERLLQKMRPVFSHDLPNQMVALQSLLQMLERDEAELLSDAGRDYVGRLHQVAHKTAGLIAFLRELGGLHAYRPQVAGVALARVLRDVQSELHEQLPDTPIECELGGDVPSVNADARLLTRALVALLGCLLERAPAGRGRLRLTGRRGAPIELRGELAWGAAGVRPARVHLQQRPEIVLAQECLAVWHACLCEVRDAVDHSLFVIHVSP